MIQPGWDNSLNLFVSSLNVMTVCYDLNFISYDSDVRLVNKRIKK